MTQFEGQQQQQQSAFNQRADNAALNLKDQLGREISARTGERVVLPPTPVPVNADGNPAGPLPPEGSYARNQMEAEQQQAQFAPHPQAAPAMGQPQPEPPHQPQEQTSQRAQERITSLVSQLRSKDQEYQQLQQAQQQHATTAEELRAQLTAQKAMMEQVLEQNLDSLDPEARAQVMADARIRQAQAQSEQRIMRQIAPQLEALQTRNLQLEKQGLSDTYRAYDPMVHDVLIDQFRTRNPNTSVEQAFRAVATHDELTVGEYRSAHAPPPSIAPGSGSATPRYVPNPTNQPDPIQQIRDDAARAAELARSTDPYDQKQATRLWNKNLADRVFGQ